MTEGRITDKAPYGRQITLVCMNHPDLTWSTKNIGSSKADGQIYLGRSVFFDEPCAYECSCSGSMLRLHPMYLEQEAVHE